MPNLQYLNPDAMGRPRGYTQVVKVDHTVYIAGQVSATSDGSVVGKGDPEAQVRQVWRNLETAVTSAGGTLQNIVKTTTYVTSIDYAAAVRKVREELFHSSNPPTSTLLVVSALASADFMVEIEAIAVVDR
jgi:enamine deaminase RidA (YjgF/YER057c/UK114 family)